MNTKTMTVRLPQELADQLELIASIDDTSVSDEVREAVRRHIDRRLADPDFQARLKDRQNRLNELVSIATTARGL